MEVLSLSELGRRIKGLAAHIAATEAEWLTLVAEFDTREGFVPAGAYCTAQWLGWHCGMDTRTAREKLKVAHALEQLPQTRATFAEGRLSYSKVRAICRAATPAIEGYLLELALWCSASQMDEIVRNVIKYGPESARRVMEADDHEPAIHLFDENLDGTVTIQFTVNREDANLIKSALVAAKHASENGPAGPTYPQVAGEQFVQMAKLAIANEGQTDAPVATVILRADIDSLKSEDGVVEAKEGFTLSAKTAKRLSCDAKVITQLERGSEILSIGRKTRIIPPRIRRALNSRDRHCRFPGCSNRKFTQSHHIRHWAEGGDTKLSNLVTLCTFHHKFCHSRNIKIEASENGFTFTENGRCFNHSGGAEQQWPKRPAVYNEDQLEWEPDTLTLYALSAIVSNVHLYESGVLT